MDGNDLKVRKGLIKILESMYIKAKDVLYTIHFDDKICFEVKRKNTKLKYYLKIEIVPFDASKSHCQVGRHGYLRKNKDAES